MDNEIYGQKKGERGSLRIVNEIDAQRNLWLEEKQQRKSQRITGENKYFKINYHVKGKKGGGIGFTPESLNSFEIYYLRIYDLKLKNIMIFMLMRNSRIPYIYKPTVY